MTEEQYFVASISSLVGSECQISEKATSNNSAKLVLIEARRLGRQFMDGFCEIKRLVQDQPTYKTQIVLFNAFKAELFFPDRVIMDLEELIEWNEDCYTTSWKRPR